MKRITIAAIFMMVAVNATATGIDVTVGDLRSHSNGMTITSVVSGYEYSRFDQPGLTYTNLIDSLADDTLLTQWNGFSVATDVDALRFIDEALQPTSQCTVSAFDTTENCGRIDNWYDSKLGDSYTTGLDYFFFSPSHTTTALFGLVEIAASGNVRMIGGWSELQTADNWVVHPTASINYLLVSGPAVVTSVTEPSAIALMSLGLLGLGFARRNRKKA